MSHYRFAAAVGCLAAALLGCGGPPPATLLTPPCGLGVLGGDLGQDLPDGERVYVTDEAVCGTDGV